MAKKQKQGRGKGTRKYGRNADKCKRYKAQGRREKNKARRQVQRDRWLEKRQARRQEVEAS